MNQKQFSFVTAVIFLAIFVLHALRLFFSWEAVIAGRFIPTWISWTAIVISGYLAYTGFKLGR